jgi:hypothetical protein
MQCDDMAPYIFIQMMVDNSTIFYLNHLLMVFYSHGFFFEILSLLEHDCDFALVRKQIKSLQQWSCLLTTNS